MSQQIDIDALREAILGGQVNGSCPNIRRERLKKLINNNSWERIGFLFGFKPQYMVLAGTKVFDWNSCNESFWKVYNVPVEPPKTLNLVSSRSEHEFKVHGKKAKPSHRDRLWKSQEGKCYYCFQPTPFSRFTVDHVVARSKGGSNKIDNKVGACSSCNNAKSSMSQAEFLASHYLDNKLKWIETCKRRAEEKHCQNGSPDVCQLAKATKIVCPEGSCDIDDGVRNAEQIA